MSVRVVDVRLVEGVRAVGGDGRHEIVLDEPLDVGGTDEGMTPVQVFLVALGACAAITMRLYARRKEWDLRDADVKVTLERPDGGGAPRVVQDIHLEGELDATQRERLLQIAGRCVVHRLVTDPLETVERLV